MVMGYNCRAMVSHPQCGSAREVNAVCQNCGLWKMGGSRDFWELYSGTWQQLWPCVLHPSTYELNRPLVCQLKYVWNVGDVTSGSTFAMPFTSCLWAMLKVLTLPLTTVFKMCELAIVRLKWKKFTVAVNNALRHLYCVWHCVMPVLPIITFWRTYIKEQNSFYAFGIIVGQISTKSRDPALMMNILGWPSSSRSEHSLLALTARWEEWGWHIVPQMLNCALWHQAT